MSSPENFMTPDAVIQRPWARLNGNRSWTVIHFDFPAMKTKGFTLIELVVACTLLLMLSTVATTSTFNFVQATANLKAQYTNVQNIMLLHKALVQAKMNYATDLALDSNEAAIQHWNTFAQQNDSVDLIALLINPASTTTNPTGSSYLPTSRNVPVTTLVNGNPVTSFVLVQITDINSLLKAYQMTDNGTPTGNIVATISVGPMFYTSTAGTTVTTVRPMLPMIDWKSGTPQEIQF
jgi:prepilin-type N-terminal cleavage/methylation domain-containing protein